MDDIHSPVMLGLDYTTVVIAGGGGLPISLEHDTCGVIRPYKLLKEWKELKDDHVILDRYLLPMLH